MGPGRGLEPKPPRAPKQRRKKGELDRTEGLVCLGTVLQWLEQKAGSQRDRKVRWGGKDQHLSQEKRPVEQWCGTGQGGDHCETFQTRRPRFGN